MKWLSLVALGALAGSAAAGPELNVAVNPLGPLAGNYDGSASYALSRHVALTGALTRDRAEHLMQATLTVPIYSHRAYSGAFVQPGLVARTEDPSGGVGPEVLVGWQGTPGQLAAGIATLAAGLGVVAFDTLAWHDTRELPVFHAHDRGSPVTIGIAAGPAVVAGRVEPDAYFRVGYTFNHRTRR